MDLRIVVDRSSPVPLYFQISAQIETALRDGTLGPGDRLTNEIALAGQLGLSRPTVAKAINDLVAKGMLLRRRGVGTEVVSNAVHRQAELTSLYDDLVRDGRSPSTTVLESSSGPGERRITELLDAPTGTPLLYLRRLRCADGDPLAVLTNWLPPPGDDLDPAGLEHDGLYTLLRARGIQPSAARLRVSARSATADDGRLLGVRRGAPLITMSRLAYGSTGRPVEYGEHVYRSDRKSVV